MAIRVVTTPVAAIDTTGRVNVLVAGEDAMAYAIEQAAPNGGWSPWLPLGSGTEKGGGFVGAQPLALAVSNFIDVTALAAFGISNSLQLHSQAKLSEWGQPWQTWNAPVVFYSPPAAIGPVGQRQLATVFAVGGGKVGVPGGLYEAGATGWIVHPGADLAQDRPPVVASSQDGRLELFGVAASWDVLHHIWETGSGAGWSGWYSHGVPAPGISLLPSPAVAPAQDGRLELFVVGTTNPMRDASVGSLFHIWQTAPNGGWSNWYSHGTPPGTALRRSPAVAPSQDGRLEMFVVGGDGAVYHKWQVAPNNGWSDWYSHGLPGSVPVTLEASPAVAASQDGRLQLFVVGTDGALYHKSQVAPNSGWSDWYSHGSP